MFIYKYQRLMEDYINGVITVEDFERDYLKIFRNETERMGQAIGKIT
ncbi:colicin immunity domain-containing protein [Neobacillus sp. NRS-1170]